MKMQMSKKNAMKMVSCIRICFGVYGYGHFDITDEEYADILMIAFNCERNSEKLIRAYYEKIEHLR